LPTAPPLDIPRGGQDCPPREGLQASVNCSNVNILLATYNNSPFVDELMASLAAQTFQDWRLIVRDAASGDDTPQRLAAWSSRLACGCSCCPRRAVLGLDQPRNRG